MHLNKSINSKNIISIDDNIYDILKNYIKENLKIEIEYISPAGLFDGKIKATLKLNEDIIDSDEHIIHRSFF